MILNNMILNNKHLKKYRTGIAFDIGNVLTYLELDTFIFQLVLEGFTEEQALDFLQKYNSAIDIGLWNIEQALSMEKCFSKKQISDLRKAWMASIKPCIPTLKVVTQLLSEGCEVALTSNMGIDHADMLCEICGEQFQKCIKHFSYIVGARKPQKIFYQSLISQYKAFNTNYSQPMFFDDKLENVESAKCFIPDSRIFNVNDYNSGEDAAEHLITMIRDI